MSWSNRWMPIEQITFKLGRVRDNCFLRSHLAYHCLVDNFLYHLGTAHVFVYRDLRDVAVSQVHHILNPDKATFPHPEKDALMVMDFPDVLRAVIEGYGRCPGLFERWKQYEPWLHIPWVLKVKFEDLLQDREERAAQIFEYGIRRLAEIWDQELQFNADGMKPVLEQMAKSSQDVSKSFTFRQGKAGKWIQEFTPELIDLFISLDDGYLERAGYEW